MAIHLYLDETLTQQIFWVSSNKPMNWEFIKSLPDDVKNQLSSLSLNIPPGELMVGAIHSLPVTIPLLLVILLLLWRRKYINQRIEKLTIRRAKRADMKAATKYSKEDAEQEDFLFAQITGLTMEDIDQLDLADSKALTDSFRKMVDN